MIGPGTGVRVYLACGGTDMRKGIAGLAALAQDVLRQKPTGGAVFAFRGRRGDRLKLLYWDGQGFCLYYKVLQRGRFPWPTATTGAARLSSAQLAMLWEGIDWRRPHWGAPPARVGWLFNLPVDCFYGVIACHVVISCMSNDVENLPQDPALLRAMIAALQAENQKMSASLRAHDLLVQALRVRIAKLQKQKFALSSEKIEREIEQLELALEDLQVALVEAGDTPPDEGDTPETNDQTSQPDEPRESRRRRPKVSKDRERRALDPGDTCPDCGGELRVIGEDVSELIDMIAAQLKLIEIARIKKSCRCCEKIVQEPAPSRPIARSMAGPNLLACILISKFDDHVPLYRQHEIFARMGADIPDTTMVGWCGGAMKTLAPLIEKIEAEIMASDLLHADDTPIRVLDRSRRDRGLGKGVRKGRIWAYVRDQRPWAGTAPPGAVYQFAPDWKEGHVLAHLRETSGILQADGYKGYAKLYAADPDGNCQFREAACWAHFRRDFHDVWAATQSEIAREALDRIGALYDIEREISGKPADLRRTVRQAKSKPRIDAFHAWAEKQLTRIPGKSELAKAFRYGLSRWSSFTLFVEDGRVAIDNNPTERALRPIDVGRRNWLFAGSDTGGETLARAMTVIETAKMNGLDPQAYLADVLDRIHDHMNNRLSELLPWNWIPVRNPVRTPAGPVQSQAA